MMVELDGAHIDAYVHQPGVVVLDWRHPGSGMSVLFDRVLDQMSSAHTDVRFATVDVSKERALARQWQVEQAPTVMAYRDGTLVFSRPGALPEPAVAALLNAIWSLDMDEVRRGVDGHGSRLAITFDPDREPSFEADTGAPPGGRGGTGSPRGAGGH